MKKQVCAFILSLVALMVHAEIQVQIDPSPVTIDEQFQLTLTQSDAQGGAPNLKVLQKDFSILGTARQVSYSVINGQSTSTSQWVITLKPLKVGVLSIPAIKIGNEQSDPMTINVEAAGTQQERGELEQQDLLLQAQVNQEKSYVNQEIIYTVKIYNSKRLLDASYEAPKVENALMIPLGDTRRYQTTQNNTSYVVEEQKYAVFPQKSGKLVIQSPVFTALVYDFDTRRLKVSDKNIELNIQPIPAAYQANWLPAKEINFSEQYENTEQTLAQGSTLVRTISIEGTGIPAQLLPSLEFKGTDVFSVYPEKGSDSNEIKQGELVGRTEFKVTYLFNKPGKIIIPAVQLPWFNTVTAKQELAILPPRSIEITPSLTQNANTNVPSTSEPQITEQNNLIHSEPKPSHSIPWSWLLALFFALAWFSTLYFNRGKKTKKINRKKKNKKALDELREACIHSNPQAAREALLKWASIHWPDASLLNLNELLKLIHEPQLKKQIQLLSEALYKKQNTMWHGEELIRLVSTLKDIQHKELRKTTVLPPINPP